MSEERNSIKVRYDDTELLLKGGFYDVTDWMGKEKHLIGLWLETPDGEYYTDLTRSFGEFVGSYGVLFPDVNNESGVESFLQENLIALPTQGMKKSGFVTYPAYRISPHVMENLFTLEEIEAYKRDYDFYDEIDEKYKGNSDWVKQELEAEKKSFDEFIAARQGRA